MTVLGRLEMFLLALACQQPPSAFTHAAKFQRILDIVTVGVKSWLANKGITREGNTIDSFVSQSRFDAYADIVKAPLFTFY